MWVNLLYNSQICIDSSESIASDRIEFAIDGVVDIQSELELSKVKWVINSESDRN